MGGTWTSLRPLVIAVALAVASAAIAEEPAVRLGEVVVTATRTSTLAEDLTTSVSVVSADDIQRRGDASVAEALRPVPGLDITRFGSPGRTAFASIRGAPPDQVLVLLDGVEVNTPTVGQFDLGDLLADGVDRIEVVRGAGGTLYGSKAIGGVINVITPRGRGPFHLTALGEAGSAATHHEAVSLSGERGPLSLFGNISYVGSDGFRPINDDYGNVSTVWRADLDMSAVGVVRGFLRYTDARLGLPDFNVAQGVLDPDAHAHNEFVSAKGEWEKTLGEALTLRASGSYVRQDQRYRDDRIDEADAEVEPVIAAHLPSEIAAVDAQADYAWLGTALTTAGMQFQETSAHVTHLSVGADQEDPGEEEIDLESFNANRSSYAFYAQQQLSLLDDTLHGVGGIRYDRYDRFGDHLTLSGSGAYLLRATGTRLRLGYAEGFRVPTFDELFQPGLGNPELEPEESWEIDAGLTQTFAGGRLRFEPIYFYREVTNLIEEVADQLPAPIAGVPEGEGTELTRNQNARFQGVELVASTRPWEWLELGASYTYLDFSTPTGVLLNRPRHRGAVTIAVEKGDLWGSGDRLRASLAVDSVGSRDSADPQNDFEPARVGSYSRTDVAVSYRLPGRLASFAITATVRNLLDRRYQEAIGFPAPGIWFLAGLRYQPVNAM